MKKLEWQKIGLGTMGPRWIHRTVSDSIDLYFGEIWGRVTHLSTGCLAEIVYRAKEEKFSDTIMSGFRLVGDERFDTTEEAIAWCEKRIMEEIAALSQHMASVAG